MNNIGYIQLHKEPITAVVDVFWSEDQDAVANWNDNIHKMAGSLAAAENK